MLAEHLTRTELVAVLELVQQCLTATSSDEVRRLVGRSRDLLPYQAALSATIETAPGRDPLEGLRVVNVDYPDAYLSELGRRGLIAVDPVVREHFRRFGLQYWGDTLSRQRDAEAGSIGEIVSLAEDYGFAKVGAGWGYAHGLRDPGGAAATFFCFHGLPRCPRTEEILELLIPHLHQALLRSGRSRRERSPLTTRETEVMRWVRQGKSTWDISAILSISERTVKFHVGNALQKLDATSRAHAVAIALEQGLIDPD